VGHAPLKCQENFFSHFLNTLSCHLKCLYGNLFNANETYIKLPLRLA
jgi:hypothetical protein